MEIDRGRGFAFCFGNLLAFLGNDSMRGIAGVTLGLIICIKTVIRIYELPLPGLDSVRAGSLYVKYWSRSSCGQGQPSLGTNTQTRLSFT